MEGRYMRCSKTSSSEMMVYSIRRLTKNQNRAKKASRFFVLKKEDKADQADNNNECRQDFNWSQNSS